ncbi:anaerobic magnesium-protoporphyrin ix monomethyl ester cyclase-related [Anaeramoeba flamelloides]|uniref:Anaerobic magnesium-protoporphyrin ix monomethyl ester cyclase-related n=1 Tax=Anaeramoeba flamelloides TaxID=1746091 RepID=A0AAV7Z9Q8_9EUKA|nr:anaerobic magnesium-protoporphyrin ix monomethyl ester cyclase-related [Anaeramoeba flamelloides]
MKSICNLISLNHCRAKDPITSLGIGSILSTLKCHSIEHNSRSYNVASKNFTIDSVVQDILKTSNKRNADVWFGAFIWNEAYIQEIIHKLKNVHHFLGRVGIAGPQVSHVLERNALECYYEDADMFIRGYAESALLELYQGKANVQGLHLSGTKDFVESANCRPHLLPSPYLDGTLSLTPFIRWETRRGCSFKCSFCQHRGADMKSKTYKFDYDRIAKEIRYFKESKIVKDIAVLDPTFNINTAWSCNILELFKGFNGKISLQIRPEILNSKFLRKALELMESGTNLVLELGVQTLHPESFQVINRYGDALPINKAIGNVKSKVKELQKYNISHDISLIFGLPHQTLESFKQDVEWCEANTSASIDAFPLILLRGTPLFYEKKKLQLIEKANIQHPLLENIQEFIKHVCSSPTMTFEDWYAMADIAYGLLQKKKKKKKVQDSLLNPFETRVERLKVLH